MTLRLLRMSCVLSLGSRSKLSVPRVESSPVLAAHSRRSERLVSPGHMLRTRRPGHIHPVPSRDRMVLSSHIADCGDRHQAGLSGTRRTAPTAEDPILPSLDQIKPLEDS